MGYDTALCLPVPCLTLAIDVCLQVTAAATVAVATVAAVVSS
jgi:hypothetical protein